MVALLLVGCGNNTTIYGDLPFIEIESDNIYAIEHIELCERKPESIFCKQSPSIGDIRPSRKYTLEILREMNSNFTYTSNDVWIYNDTVYEDLRGDCEDIASTMAKHMIDDGIGKEWLYLAYRKISETEAHLFLAVDTIDAGLLHLDYANSGYPIEPRINFHMKMTDPGVYKWIKGNIK